MQKNKINIGRNNVRKLFLFIAILSLSYTALGVSGDLEKLINDYYNNSEYDLMSMRGKNENITKPSNRRITEKPILNISKSELMRVGEKIFQNETGGAIENLVHWNAGENFPSLGIGHFIWYKKGRAGGESFPQMVSFYRAKGIKLPRIIEENKGSPWQNRAELLRKRENGDKDVWELISFFNRTRDIQILFIFERLEDSLEKILNATNDRDNVRMQFYRVANSPNGLYALIDYVNFKGEGISGGRYGNTGWGLRQVLENMKGSEVGRSALVEFSNSAKHVLEKRANNSRKDRKWLAGWFKRVDTYKTFQVN